jgi:glycosyltransferase involved in cell wall biosynthesis
MSSIPKFSVIVPMYNVEKYLPKCIESIRQQTLRDIEIILVDDGSPDRCGEMAEDYARKDERIRVVHRTNGGLGPARNSGLDVATGEYVGFVDSDDWVEPDMYERLYETAKANGADIVFTGLKTVGNGKTLQVREHPFAGRSLHGEDEIFPLRAAFYGAPPSKMADDPTPISVWIGGYRRVFLEENNLRFVNVRSEDKFFNTHACQAANIVTCISGSPYCYRKDNQPSITKTFNEKTIDSFFELFNLLGQMVDEEPEKFRDECRVREQRCVIDYCRVLIGMIESSDMEDTAKAVYIHYLVNNSIIHQACEDYPWWKLSVRQMIFYWTTRLGAVRSTRLLVRMRARRMA